MEDLKYCKLCLITDVKMYSITVSSLNKAYSQLLQMPTPGHDHYVCYECENLLHKYYKFYLRCKTAEGVLALLSADTSKVTIQNIKTVDRKLLHLESRLSVIPIETYSTNVQSEIQHDLENSEKNLSNEIKNESYIETDVLKSEIEIKTCQTNVRIGSFATIEPCGQQIDQFNNGPLYNDFNDSNETEFSVIQHTTRNRKRKMPLMDKSTRKLNKATSKINVKPVGKVSEVLSNKTMQLSKKKIKISNKDNNLINDVLIHEIDFKKDKNKQDVEVKPRNKSGPKFNENYFKDYAKVVLLTPEEAMKEVLLRKESNNYKHCSFKCELCFRGFETEATFDKHMKKHSREYGAYKCEYCHLRFPNQRFLGRHNLGSHQRKFYCISCPYTCFCTHQAKNHIEKHKGRTYPCKECGEVFRMPNTLLMHMRVKHPTECVCGLCGSTFATTRGLAVHNMSQHRQETNEGNGPNCEVCGVKFATVIAWKKHLVLSSKHEVSNGCEFCGETFADEASLKLHLKKHARKQSGRVPPVQIPSKCVICAEWLTSRDQYKTHMTSLHPLSAEAKRIDFAERKKQGSVICEVCGKMVKSKSLLVYHQRKHTGERPLQCARCDKRFDAPATLHAHVYARHTNVNLPCHMCHKRFSNRNALAKHIKIHLGIRPYKCSICDKAFPHLCDVKVHMKHAHYKVPWPKKRDRNKQKTENTETE